MTVDSVLLKDGRADTAKGADIASAGTTDIGAATGNFVHVTGTNAITALGTITAGRVRVVTFDGALTLTHNATSLILPGGANITTAAGDVGIFVSEGSGNWRCVAYLIAAVAPFDRRAPGAIGGTTPAAGTFTTLSCSGAGAMTSGLAVSGNVLTSAENFAIASGKKIFIDGVGANGDTYIIEGTANEQHFYANNTFAFRIAAGIIDSKVTLYARVGGESEGNWAPGTDNSYTLGTAGKRWTVVYATTGSINTSDERAKQDIGAIPDAWLDAWGEVQYSRFKMRDAVAAKGAAARWHVGVVAQRVKEAFERHGIDAFEIGLLCYDEWEEIPADEKNERPGTPAGSSYGVRYEEALALEAAYLRRAIAWL